MRRVTTDKVNIICDLITVFRKLQQNSNGKKKNEK